MLCIGDVLDAQTVRELRKQLADQPFVDGGETAGWAAGQVKRNEQLSREAPAYAGIQARLLDALRSNALFAIAAAPHSFRPLLISRYAMGMGYGDHVDNALMGDATKTRTDLSFTLFLSDPESYEGGDLIIEDSGGARSVKLPAGSLVLYSSSTLHRVDPVTSGERLVAVGWVQSFIRSAEARAILFDLETARRSLFERDGKSAEFDQLSRAASNLWRMWSEP